MTPIDFMRHELPVARVRARWRRLRAWWRTRTLTRVRAAVCRNGHTVVPSADRGTWCYECERPNAVELGYATSKDPMGDFLNAYEEYLDGRRLYENVPRLPPVRIR